MRLKKIIKRIIKPICYKEYLYYFGEFESWNQAVNEAKKYGKGYKEDSILKQVYEATEKVRRGEALYEQDGVCFYEENNNWELISAILYTQLKLGRITVLDMGGALGSTYFRYRKLLEEIKAEWCVVEQAHYVDLGKKYIPELDFFYTIDEAFASTLNPNVLLLSGVLMYLEKPFEMLEAMLNKNIPYVIIDETAFFAEEDKNTSILLQHVPRSIYNAVYPLHLFGLNEFRNAINKCGYHIITEWEYKGGQIPIKKGIRIINTMDKGFLLKKN